MTAQSEVHEPAPPQATPAAQPASPPTPSPPKPEDEKASRFEKPLADDKLREETRDLLYEQNLEPGAVGSDTMRKAIQSFEKQAGLPDKDTPTEGLLDALRSAKSLSPWGAITVSSDVKAWGMSWNKPTRTSAVAEAKSRCGTGACTQELTFHGQGCGAFALSSKQWNVSHRDGGDAARKAAMSDCGKGGAACRVIGSVCADGSDKTD